MIVVVALVPAGAAAVTVLSTGAAAEKGEVLTPKELKTARVRI